MQILSSSSKSRILVVDDEPSVRETIAGYLDQHGYSCETAESGSAALEQLRKTEFDLLVSDINMPGLTGLELFEAVRFDFPETAVIMLTGVLEIETAVEVMKRGAYDYITKPVDMPVVLERVRGALENRRQKLEEAGILQHLQRQLSQRGFALSDAVKRLQTQRLRTLESLVKALDVREHETRMHSQRVQAYAVRLAESFSFRDPERVDLARGALLHDIGKIGISDQILLKPGRLNAAEWAEMKQHPRIGCEILSGMPFLNRAATMILHHHERFDGKGYPDGLRGEEIPLEDRIFTVVDSYDALTNDRPYRKRRLPRQVRQLIRERSGSQFDPKVVEAFLSIPAEEWEEIAARFR